MDKDEFELIPVTPIRRLEKRIDDLEKSSGSGVDTREFFKELVEIVRMNQQIVDELAKANDALRIEISKLPSKIEDLVNNLNELLSYIKASAAEEPAQAAQTSVSPLIEKLDQLIESNKKIVESHQNVLTAIEEMDKKLKRPALPGMPLRKPMPPRLA